MAQLLHGSARTTQAIRGELQRSTESLQVLAARYHLNPKTVAKWRGSTSVADARRGPLPASTVLSPAQEAACVAFRQLSLLPLDDCLYALQESIPQLSRSALHRCFQRHGLSRLPPPEVQADGPDKRKTFKAYPICYLHVDFATLRTEARKAYLFVAVDRTSKVAIAELHPAATQAIAAAFLRRVLARLPYQVHKVLTYNGGQFGNMPHHVHCGRHIFDQVCDEHGIEHRFTKPAHPSTNGQVERLNRTFKEATVKVFHYDTAEALDTHLQAFLRVYLFTKRLKMLKGLTPREFVCAEWRKNPSIFHRDLTQHPLGLYN